MKNSQFFSIWRPYEPGSGPWLLPPQAHLRFLPDFYSSWGGIQSIAIIALLCVSPLSRAEPDKLTQPLYILKMRPAPAKAGDSTPTEQGGEKLERSPAMALILNRLLSLQHPEQAAKPSPEIHMQKLAPNPTPLPRPSEPPELERPQIAVPKLLTYEILATDESLFLALRRWTTRQGVQLIWDAGKDFPARNTAYPAKNLNDAIEMVMADTERSNYPLHACSYANRVIRILHISQSCQRN
jgi:hypothetical protein